MSKKIAVIGTGAGGLSATAHLAKQGFDVIGFERNVWDYPSWDIDSVYAPVIHGAIPEEMFFFISPNSLKDPTGSMAPAGSTAVEVVTTMPWEPFAKWEHVPPAERGAEYDELMAGLKCRIRDQLADRYPELVADVEVCELSSPLAYRHHLNAIDGELYGPAQTPEQSIGDRFSPTGSPNGLVLAGQVVMGGGVWPCIVSGRVASTILAKQLGHQHAQTDAKQR